MNWMVNEKGGFGSLSTFGALIGVCVLDHLLVGEQSVLSLDVVKSVFHTDFLVGGYLLKRVGKQIVCKPHPARGVWGIPP